MDIRNLIIIGSGPAGYTAAIYAARADLKPLVFEGFYSGPAGGQLMTTTEVENYPGFPKGITGPDLMLAFREQAIRFEAECITQDVQKVDLTSKPFKVISNDKEFLAHSIIIATGATAKRLDIPGARDGELWQKGISACAVCDGAMPIFRDKNVYVVGGGDTAAEEALFLTKYAKRVFVVHRRDELRASSIMAERLKSHPKVEILWNKEMIEVKGATVVEEVILKDTQTGELSNHQANGVFFAIGHTPNTAFLAGQLPVDEKGYIQTESHSSKTSLEGVFACGDVQDAIYRQAVTAAGSGCMAALDAERWLSHQLSNT